MQVWAEITPEPVCFADMAAAIPAVNMVFVEAACISGQIAGFFILHNRFHTIILLSAFPFGFIYVYGYSGPSGEAARRVLLFHSSASKASVSEATANSFIALKSFCLIFFLPIPV